MAKPMKKVKKNDDTLQNRKPTPKAKPMPKVAGKKPVCSCAKSHWEDLKCPEHGYEPIQKLENLKEFLSKWNRFTVPAKFFIVYHILIMEDERYNHLKDKYLPRCYDFMINDRRLGIVY